MCQMKILITQQFNRHRLTLLHTLRSELFFIDPAFLCLAADGFKLWLAIDQPFPLIAIADTVDEVDG